MKVGQPGILLIDIICLKSTVKAEIFIAFDGREDEKMWLRDQLESI